jgi:hypothetical protein
MESKLRNAATEGLGRRMRVRLTPPQSLRYESLSELQCRSQYREIGSWTTFTLPGMKHRVKSAQMGRERETRGSRQVKTQGHLIGPAQLQKQKARHWNVSALLLLLTFGATCLVTTPMPQAIAMVCRLSEMKAAPSPGACPHYYVLNPSSASNLFEMR